MIKTRIVPTEIHYGTLSEFNASERIWPFGSILQPTDSNEIRYGNNKDVFSDLFSIPGQALQQADAIDPLGDTTDLTAIAGVFADLAAARTAVETLRSDSEARLDAIEAKLDELINGLTGASLIAGA